MRELFFKIFGEKPENDFNKVEMFSWTHILYLVLILSVIVILTILYYKKRLKNKKRILDIVAIIMTVLYIGDFFMGICTKIPSINSSLFNSSNLIRLPLDLSMEEISSVI